MIFSSYYLWENLTKAGCTFCVSSFVSFLFFAILLFFFHVLLELLLSVWNSINYFLDILVGIRLFLIHILHLVGGSHLLLLHHLLLVDGSSILFLCHLILLLIVFGSVLDDVSIFSHVNLLVHRCIGHSITWWWNVLTLVTIVEFSDSTLKKEKKFKITCSNFITDKVVFPS